MQTQTHIHKGLVRKQKELLKRKYGRCYMIPVVAELRIAHEGWNEKTARGKVDYYFRVGKNTYHIYDIVEKLIENL